MIHESFNTLGNDELYARPLNTIEFLSTLYATAQSGVLQFVALAPEGVKRYPRTVVKWYEFGAPDPDTLLHSLQALNANGYGVYFSVGTRRDVLPSERRVSTKTGEVYTVQPRGGKEHVEAITALWAEVDDATPEALSRLMWCIGYPPSIVVFSGGGWHGYWLLSEALKITDENRYTVDRALYALAKAAEADTHSAELARILRLPGSVNTKPGRKNALCHVTAGYGVRYDLQDLLKALRPHAPREIPRPERDIPEQARVGLPRYVDEFLQAGAPRGSRNATLYKVACAYRDARVDMQACIQDTAHVVVSDDFSREEAERTIASAYRRTPQTNVENSAGLRMGFADRVKRGKQR